MQTAQFGTKEWVQENQNRADYMNFLYDHFDRDHAPIGLRHTFTGLAKLRVEELGRPLMEDEVKVWHKLDHAVGAN
tara:strand:+ start:1912 stop:2139 length:228 start_codon:yes stop_codon:yes gene_type:complete